MKKKTTYLAGPMTGLPDLNFPTFHARAAELRALGHEVVNPAELAGDDEGCHRNLIAKSMMIKYSTTASDALIA